LTSTGVSTPARQSSASPRPSSLTLKLKLRISRTPPTSGLYTWQASHLTPGSAPSVRECATLNPEGPKWPNSYSTYIQDRMLGWAPALLARLFVQQSRGSIEVFVSPTGNDSNGGGSATAGPVHCRGAAPAAAPHPQHPPPRWLRGWLCTRPRHCAGRRGAVADGVRAHQRHPRCSTGAAWLPRGVHSAWRAARGAGIGAAVDWCRFERAGKL
jgi:hypothetical protein